MGDPTSVVHSDPEILGGTPVFAGTRVPLQSLIDYLGGGDTLDEFLRQFPSVRREQAQAALALARERRAKPGALPPDRPSEDGEGDAPVRGRRRVLCDESVPGEVSAAVVGHDVRRVHALGWSGMQNEALLRVAREAGFDVLVTVDRRLEYQHNIQASDLALVVIRTRSTRVPDLLPALPALLDALPTVTAGTVTHVLGT